MLLPNGQQTTDLMLLSADLSVYGNIRLLLDCEFSEYADFMFLLNGLTRL